MANKYVVAVYFCDRSFGGREEGGWWYDTGHLVKLCKVFGNEDQAYGYCAKMNNKLDKTINKGRRPISSVLSTGRYHAEVHENCPPKYYPESRPYYE